MASHFLLGATVAILASSAQLSANTYLFGTPSNATVNSLPVDVQVQVDIRTPTYMVISVLNLEADPSSEVQNVSAVTFTFASSLAGLGSISFSSSAVPVTISQHGAYALASAAPTGWVTAATSAGANLTHLSFCDVGNLNAGCATTTDGANWPAAAIIGPPASDGTYSTSGSGLAKNKNNPMLFEEAEYYVTIATTSSIPVPYLRRCPIWCGVRDVEQSRRPSQLHRVSDAGTLNGGHILRPGCAAGLLGTPESSLKG